jgi:hypothetical protein
MAAAIEVKFFNSYLLKKIKSIQQVKPYSTYAEDGILFSFKAGDNYFTISTSIGDIPRFIGPGQKITYTKDGETFTHIITGWEPSSVPYRVYVNNLIEVTFDESTSPYVSLNFGDIVDFNFIPGASRYTEESIEDWYIEESRIRGGYNNTSTDYGVRAYIVAESPARQKRTSSLIYSGLFNSRTGINNTNQFSSAEDISRTVDPSQGSIQKLYSEDTNLMIFQELKVSRALIDKDAVYSAEGQPLTTSSLEVIGEIQAYSGNYGISTNPESFAVYGYRKYFTDKNKNVVLRLSQDGITEISSYGMVDYFRDTLSAVGNGGKLIGSWDMYNKLYTLSIQPVSTGGRSVFSTLSFDEDSLGWTSRYSFKPDFGFSLRSNFYTVYNGNVWKHYSTEVPYCNFYGSQYYSTVTTVLNAEQSNSKNFQTINYEGTNGWACTSISTDSDTGVPILSSAVSTDLSILENQLFTNNFKVKENKFYGNIINDSTVQNENVIFGQSASGVKGFYMLNTFAFPDPSNDVLVFNNFAILFAVSSTFTISGN